MVEPRYMPIEELRKRIGEKGGIPEDIGDLALETHVKLRNAIAPALGALKLAYRRGFQAGQEKEREELGMTEFYLFRRDGSRIVHAVQTKHGSMGRFSLDRMFGGGMSIPCGQKAAGDGVLSPMTVSSKYVSCKGCWRVLGIKGKISTWKPDPIVEDKGPRCLGIPG